LWYPKSVKYLGFDTYPELALTAADVTSVLNNVSGIQLLDRSVVKARSFERYINIWGLLLKQSPPTVQQSMLLANVTGAFNIKQLTNGKYYSSTARFTV
jgi:hypothetical protein